MRSEREFLEQVEEELRTSAVGLDHRRVHRGEARVHAPGDCRKCDLVSLADEAADRHALLVADTVGRR